MMGQDFQHPGGLREEAAMAVGVDAPESAAGVAEAMKIEGVEGAGVGQDTDGSEVLVVYLRDAAAAGRVPKSLGGRRVRTQVTGTINAQI